MFRPVVRNERKSTIQDVDETSESRLITLIDRAVEFELLAERISNDLDEGGELRLLLRKASKITRQRMERYVVTHDLDLFQ